MSKTIEELLAARAAREAEAALALEAHKRLVLELEDKFCTELGKRGEAWELVNEDNTNGEGPICVKLGDPTAHKLWQSKPSTPEDQFTYVSPSVIYPDRARFNEIAVRRPQLLSRCTAAMTRLFGFSDEVLKGKL
jgi:hypothetical protein